MGAGSSAAATIDVVPGGECRVRIVERQREVPGTVDAASATADELQRRLRQIADVHANNAEAQRTKGWSVHFQSAHGLVGAGAFAVFTLNLGGGASIFYGSAGASTRKAYRPAHAFAGAVGLLLGLGAILTGIVSLAGRGDNAADKDVLFKWTAILTMLLGVTTGLVFTYPK